MICSEVEWFLPIKKTPAETRGEYSEEVSWAGGDPQVLPSQQVPFAPF